MTTHRSRHVLAAGLAVLTLMACADSPVETELSSNDAFSNGKSHNDQVPEEAAGPPYYSPLGNGLVPHDGEWAAIPFLRELGCIDAMANLYAPYPAFGCTLTVEGHERWQDGKWDDGLPWDGVAPRQTQYRGLGAVPIIFVPWTQLEAELMDGHITLAELMALSPVRTGSATFYKETNILGLSGPHGIGRGTYTINARGTMVGEPGEFRLLVNEVRGQLIQVHIDLP